MTPTTELHSAYHWICDACGRDNFCRAVTHYPSEEEIRHVCDNLGFDEEVFRADAIQGKFCTRPDRVKCEHCKAEYRARDEGEEEFREERGIPNDD